MDGRQYGTEYNPLYPISSSLLSRQIPRLSLEEVPHYLPRTHYQQSTAHAALSSTSQANHSSLPPLNSANSERQANNAPPSVSPTIQYVNGAQFQYTSPYTAHAIPRQALYDKQHTNTSMQGLQERERQSQHSTVHPGMQGTRTPSVSNTQSHTRSPSGSFSTDITSTLLNNIMGPLLRQQDEKMDTKFNMLLHQLSNVNDKLEKASNASGDETRTGNETILKALTLIAQKQQALIDDVHAIKSFVGLNEHAKRPAYGEDDSGSLYQKLSEITHLVGDWIEKAGDPEANAERRLVDEIREYQQSVAFRNPSPVRHEMGTSPIPSRYLSDEDMAMARDRSVYAAATTPLARVVHHEMAVSPIRLGEQKTDFALQKLQLSTVHQAAAASPFSTSRQAQTPNPRVSPVSIDGESQPDGDQPQAANDTLGNGVSEPENHLPDTDINPFRRAASRAKQTPSKRPTFQPAVFTNLDLSDAHIRRPGFSPANWRGNVHETGEFSSAFNPTSSSSPKGGPIQTSVDLDVDESLGGPSFARAPRLQKERSLSSESTSMHASKSPQSSTGLHHDVPMSITSTKSSTSEASSVLSLGYPPQIDAPVEKQQIAPVTSPRSDEEDTVANMVLDLPSSSQIDPADEDDRQNEVDATDGEDEALSSVDHSETPKRPRAISDSISPLFTQSSRNGTPMVASSCSPPAAELEPDSMQPQAAGSNSDPPASPMAEDLPRSPEKPATEQQVTTAPLAETPPRPPVLVASQEVIEIGSSSVSPPPVAARRRPKKALPSPSVSVIEISSDDDDDVLPQLPAKKSPSSMVQVKAEKLDDAPTVPREAEKPVDHPAVSITLQGATPEPEQGQEQVAVTPAPKTKSTNLLDDLLKRQLSPITPLPGDDKVKSKKAFDPKKYADGLQDDEDDIVPAKRVAKRPVRSSPRISLGSSQDSATVLKNKDTSKKKKENLAAPAEKGRAAPVLKLFKRKGENLAATRIKKRKITKKAAAGSDEEVDVAPLKKASMRPRSDTVTASGKSSKVGLKQEATSSPTKRPRGRPKKKRPEWPEPLPLVHGSAQPMIKCDGCPFWFHYSCVAVQPDDIRLRPDEIFYCPACAAGVVQNRKNTQLDLADSTQQFCGRPECAIETNYFLSKFIGRRRIPKDSTLVPQYLVKWEGWRLVHATWENPQDLGIDNPEEYVEALATELRAQGLEFDKDDNDFNVILLQEAKDAGWGPNGGHHKRWRAPHYDSGDDLEYDLA